MQSIPRTVLLDTKTGSNLLQWPVVEVENLRMRGKRFDGLAVQPGSVVPLDVGKATQLDIEAVFHVDVDASSAAGSVAGADASYDCSSSGGASGRGLLGPFGLLVLADEGLSEQTAVYFYLVKGADGKLSTHFCQDAFRYAQSTHVRQSIHNPHTEV
jgi:beta-fructofuranosidase